MGVQGSTGTLWEYKTIFIDLIKQIIIVNIRFFPGTYTYTVQRGFKLKFDLSSLQEERKDYLSLLQRERKKSLKINTYYLDL